MTLKPEGPLLLIGALLLLIIPALIINGFASSGGVFTQNTTPYDYGTCTSAVCPAFDGTDPCPTNCVFTPVSLLNPNSPFTYLFSGDIPGFISAFTTGGANQPQSNLGVLTQCQPIVYAGTPSAGTGGKGYGNFLNVLKFKCATISWLNTKSFVNGYPPIQPLPLSECNMKAVGSEFACFNVTSNNQGDNPGNINGNSNNCSPQDWDGNVNDMGGNGSVVLNNWLVVGSLVNPANGASTNQTGSITFFGDYCDGANPADAGFVMYQFVQTSSNFNNVIYFGGFLAGAVMLVMSMGVFFGGEILGTGIDIGSNPQGTKLFQTFGIGLFIFMPLYSEFNLWVTSLGLGLGLVVTMIIFLLFFMGMFLFLGGSVSSSSTNMGATT